MRSIYRLVVLLLLAFMFRSPLYRLQQTANHLIRSASPAVSTFTTRPFSATALRKQNDDAMSDRPNGTIAKSGLELLTFGTPNGHKASIILEELKEAYGKPDYVFQSIHIGQNIQKEPWFTEYGPNGRIPVLIDHDNGDLGIMEGAAILTYVTRNFDPDHKLSFTKDPELSQCEQWVAWQHGGLGPMQGQANHFYRLAKERIPYPTQRYVGETERLYGVLDIRLKGREYLVGDKYSIADIANFSWVNVAYIAGVNLENFPNLYKWWERINARPAVKRGVAIPEESSLTNEAYKRRLKEEDGFKEKEDELGNLLKKAQEQYEYKFSSP
ncbi:unnamed protein product [Cercospora beticola]|nr:unnamed protein product [Cercospora beticola]